MWKLLEICQQTYFIYCNFNNNTQDVTFVLYDLKKTWSQTLTHQDVKQKVKLLNKRFDFNDDNIQEALSSNAIQSAVIEDQPSTSANNLDSCLLKLKYRVKSCPFNFEWVLRRQDLVEFQKTFVTPLLLALLGCHQQVEVLMDSIRKKDLELKQFRSEGAVLNRKTLATKPFDFEGFKKKYENCNKIANNFRELAKYVKENNPNEESEMNEQLPTKQDIKPTEHLNRHQGINEKMNPKHRKRKINEIKMQRLEQHLKRRKQGLEYESSQSQSLSVDNTKATEETDIKYLKQDQLNTRKQQEKGESECISLPRRSSRYTFIKNTQDNTSSEDKNASCKEDNTGGTITVAKANSSFVDMPEDSSTDSNKELTKLNTKNNNHNERYKKGVKSLELSKNSQTKSPEKSSECSNVFDFSTDSEDNTPLTERKNLLKSKSKHHKPLLKGKKLLRKNSSTTSSPILDYVSADSLFPRTSTSQSKNLSHSQTPVVINEISLQLHTIRKELESLEAMRLADLKQRTCKI